MWRRSCCAGPRPRAGAFLSGVRGAQFNRVPLQSERLMDPKWSEDLPIYRQLRDRVVEMILEGVLGDGDALPSVRNVVEKEWPKVLEMIDRLGLDAEELLSRSTESTEEGNDDE